MKTDRVQEILSAIKDVRIAVCGDFCLDVYWMLDPRGSEVSVETGLPARAVGSHHYSLGGASNIVANLAALAPAAIQVVGVIGDDIFGRELVRQLGELDVDVSRLVVQPDDFDTVAYCKQYLEGDEEPRIDFGLFNQRTEATDAAVLDGLRHALETADVVVFNQQLPGSLTNDSFIAGANALFAEYGDKIVLLDSRHYAERFSGVYRKVNEVEAAALNGVDASPGDILPLAELDRFARALHGQSSKPVFITRGARGMLVCDAGEVSEAPGIQLLTKLDPVGAGDTTLSAIACCLAANVAPVEAAEFVNHAAAVTVQKLFQTGTASGEEILAIAKDPAYIFQPELAEDIRQAAHVGDSEIELYCGPNVIQPGRIAHAVFDHDGTISALRQGWEAVMEAMMTRAILGDQYDFADETLCRKVRSRVLDYVDKSTGIQTILQMEALATIVGEFGIVPPDQILDKFEYKEIYNTALMEMVSGRIDKFARGELDVNDYTIKGAVPFLEMLRERDVTLYLASGTDKDDVVREAEALGYAGLFNGGIYGSVGDVSKYSKKLVISKILSDNGLKGPELACFGDGPVEIRECRNHDGIAVGIASDEIRRHGLNARKRTRLIKVGAHVVAPDFSQPAVLIEVLFGE